jgi:hypothetical protein
MAKGKKTEPKKKRNPPLKTNLSFEELMRLAVNRPPKKSRKK